MTALISFLLPEFSVVRLVAVAVAPLPEVAFVLQVAAVGAAIGSAIGMRRRRRDADADAWQITTAWSTLGLVIGMAVVVILAL